jgi:uncharacterized membrane-anchored protein YhcB (DUF1043 family)
MSALASIMNNIAIGLGLLVGLPIITYLVVRMATMAYYKAKKELNESSESEK